MQSPDQLPQVVVSVDEGQAVINWYELFDGLLVHVFVVVSQVH